ncbi:hypothetical protein CTEN210_12213 [Chaetoceros tenuissimus]|uniref:HSF-type DNA-binding domain-containing protein n=1 Tax=Chaetoceros tenuissimus TaxID=426638 RepID=A0AAD3D0S3_9STRA|nr:hypothetical protein CTEN210_12213 [Chaetoceros tenuissimus]
MQAFNSNKNCTSAACEEHEMNNHLDIGGASGALSSSDGERKLELPTKVKGPGVEEEEDKHEKMMIAITGKSSRERSTKDKAVKFPQKLMYVLTCGDYNHIVHWKTNQIDGSDIFVIDDINAFTSEVLPSLFKVAKYESFQRKLYRWGILKTQRSRSEKKMRKSISYSHPLFKKGDFVLASQMTCSGPQAKQEKSVLKFRKRLQRKFTQMKPSSAQVLESSYVGSLESTSQEKCLSGIGDLVSIPPNSTSDLISFPPSARQTRETTDHQDFEDITLSIYSPEDGPISLQVSSILNQSRGADGRNRNIELQEERNISEVCDRSNFRSSYPHYNTSSLGQLNYTMQDAHSFSSLGSNFPGYYNNSFQQAIPSIIEQNQDGFQQTIPRIQQNQGIVRRASIISTTSHDTSSSFFEETNFPPALSNFRRDTIYDRSREDQILDNTYAVLKSRQGNSRYSI